MITKEELKKIILYNEDTGILIWKISRGKAKSGNAAGYVNGQGYICIKINGYMYLAHRLAWILYYGEWPCGIVDHLDHNKQNNCIKNLRDVSYLINSQNKICATQTKNRTSKYLGVSFNKQHGKYESRITINGKHEFLGLFSNEIDAYNAYLNVKRLKHEGNLL